MPRDKQQPNTSEMPRRPTSDHFGWCAPRHGARSDRSSNETETRRSQSQQDPQYKQASSATVQVHMHSITARPRSFMSHSRARKAVTDFRNAQVERRRFAVFRALSIQSPGLQPVEQGDHQEL
mmetsp:Transcript_15008/g.60258  ORF Transcript_15008/g.60258 Transcript_15008/m.60258 type:complete len:123 (+) Transcript_15008:63-431(+)